MDDLFGVVHNADVDEFTKDQSGSGTACQNVFGSALGRSRRFRLRRMGKPKILALVCGSEDLGHLLQEKLGV